MYTLEMVVSAPSKSKGCGPGSQIRRFNATEGSGDAWVALRSLDMIIFMGGLLKLVIVVGLNFVPVYTFQIVDYYLGVTRILSALSKRGDKEAGCDVWNTSDFTYHSLKNGVCQQTASTGEAEGRIKDGH